MPTHAFVRQPTNAFERYWIGATLFFLAFALPNTWFTASERSAEVVSSNSTATVVFLSLFFVVFSRIGGAWVYPLKAVVAVPALGLFLMVVSLSPLWSEATAISGRRIVSVVTTALFAAAVYARLDRRDFLVLLARVLLVGAVINLIWAFAVPGVGGGDNWGGVWNGKNVLGRVSGLSVIVLILAAREERQRRALFYAGAGLCAFLVLQSNSTTSFVGTLGLLGLIVVYNAFRARRTLFGAVVVSLGMGTVLSYLAATANLAWITDQLGKDVTLTGRTTLWSMLLDVIGERPLLGRGFGTFWQGYFSPAHEVWVQNTWLPPHGHNIFIDLMLDVGLLGTLPFVYVLGQGLARSVRLIRLETGTAPLFPLVFLSFLLLFSATEAGPVGRNMLWVIFIYVILDLAAQVKREAPESVTQVESPRSDPSVLSTSG